MVRALGGSSTCVVIDARITIGRAPDADLQLLDPHVSRRHARIERDANGETVLIDLASTSGTRIGDVRVDRHVLQDGDLIRIAGVTLRYEEVGEPPRQSRAQVERGIRALRPTLRLGAIALEPAHDIVPERIIMPLERAVETPAPALSMAAAPGLVMPPLSVPRSRSVTHARPARRWTPSAMDPADLHSGHTAQYIPRDLDDAPLAESLYEDDPEPPPDPDESRRIIGEVFEYRTLRMRAVRWRGGCTEGRPGSFCESCREVAAQPLKGDEVAFLGDAAAARVVEAIGIDLQVEGDDNLAAHRLYVRLGFELAGRRRRYYADGADACLYRRPLPAAFRG